jgi:ABC-type histidine transport system ATPase subunit
MKKLAEEHMTMIIVTHEMDLPRRSVTACCSWIKGVVVEEGPPSKIFRNPAQ